MIENLDNIKNNIIFKPYANIYSKNESAGIFSALIFECQKNVRFMDEFWQRESEK